MSVFELVLLIIAGLLLIMAAMLSVFSASELTKTSGYKDNVKLTSAHKWLTWSSVVAWIGILVLIILLVAYINQASKSQGGDMSHTWGVRLFLFLTLSILIAAGIMAATGAIDIRDSKNTAVKKSGAQSNAIAATVLMLAGAGLIIIAFIASLFNKGSSKDSVKDTTNKDSTDEKKISTSKNSTDMIDKVKVGGKSIEDSAIEMADFSKIETLLADNPELVLA